MRTLYIIGALPEMKIHVSPAQDHARLALTEAALTAADRSWRAEMHRNYGPDAVLNHAFSPEGQGDLGTTLRLTYEARRIAVALWRYERRGYRKQPFESLTAARLTQLHPAMKGSLHG